MVRNSAVKRNSNRSSPRVAKSKSFSDSRDDSSSSKQQKSLSSSQRSRGSKTSKTSPPKKKAKQKSHNMLVGNKIFKIGHKILREIKFYQTSTQNLIPKLPFSRLIHEVIQQIKPTELRIQRSALEALQEASELYLIQFLSDSYACCLHARRVTLIPRDMALIQFLRGTNL